jgi:hypothetical protein
MTKFHIKKENNAMKTKKINKKLVLNKSTVADLEMKKVKGGCFPSCPKCCPSYETDCGDTVEICFCRVEYP